MLEDLAARWEAEIAVLVSAMPSMKVAAQVQYLAQLQRELPAQLNRFGYSDLAERFVTRFDNVQQQAMETLPALKVPVKRLAPLNEAAWATLRQIAVDDLVKAGANAVAAVSRGVVMAAVGGRSRATMIRDVRKTLAGKFVNYASTYADTALVSYDRRVSWDMWDAAGIAKFLYRGPMDVKTRAWCEARVGKTFTREQVEAMDNGTRLAPVSVYGGAWNCRRVRTPVADTGNGPSSHLAFRDGFAEIARTKAGIESIWAVTMVQGVLSSRKSGIGMYLKIGILTFDGMSPRSIAQFRIPMKFSATNRTSKWQSSIGRLEREKTFEWLCWSSRQVVFTEARL